MDVQQITQPECSLPATSPSLVRDEDGAAASPQGARPPPGNTTNDDEQGDASMPAGAMSHQQQTAAASPTATAAVAGGFFYARYCHKAHFIPLSALPRDYEVNMLALASPSFADYLSIGCRQLSSTTV